MLGVGVGGVVDMLMPRAKKAGFETDVKGFVQTGAEVAMQLSLNALAAATVIKALGKVGISDPGNGFAFILSLQASQPQLLIKLSQLGMGIKMLFSHTEVHPILGLQPVGDQITLSNSAYRAYAAKMGGLD